MVSSACPFTTTASHARFTEMEAPNFESIFECISGGVNNVIVIVLVLVNTDRQTSIQTDRRHTYLRRVIE